MRTVDHRYLLSQPCRSCKRTPAIIFCEDTGRDGSVGQPYLRSVAPCCADMATFEFMGTTYRYNHRTRLPERIAHDAA